MAHEPRERAFRHHRSHNTGVQGRTGDVHGLEIPLCFTHAAGFWVAVGLGYYESCCYEHLCVRVLYGHVGHFSGMYLGVELLGHREPYT